MINDIAYLCRYRERPTELRRGVVVLIKRVNLFFPLLHLLVRPLLLRSRGARIGQLVVVGKAKISGDFSKLAVGDQSSFGRCEIVLHDMVTIGRCVVINDGALLLTASHSLSDPGWMQKKKPITVGDYAWIASNAIILPGVSIGKGAVVGAGAVVRRDVPNYGIVTGNPSVLHPTERTKSFAYSPVLFNAPFEAWIGRNIENIPSELDAA